MARFNVKSLRYEPEPNPAEDAVAFSGGLLLGGLIGAAVAMALAPTDGSTLRRRIVARFDELLGRERTESEWAGVAPVTGVAPVAAAPAAVAPPPVGASVATSVSPAAPPVAPPAAAVSGAAGSA